MSLRPRSRKTGTALAAGLLTAAATMTMAAAPTANAASGTRLAANVPSTSPAPERFIPNASGSIACPSGRACAVVTNAGTKYFFQFYKYGRYRLSYFLGSGPVHNNQTGSAAMRFYDRNGVQLRDRGCVRAGGHEWINWDPVWYIGLTQTPC
ncbi:hypothetical protein [Spirillospora sp. NPDC047279]|uniref:hypothetical protein n=1 Tax=Spirillospora sp. NPDC047279 TaxID=3155478 RepID=UPI0033C082D8